MLDHSELYAQAIEAGSRMIRPEALVDVTDPDMTILNAADSGHIPYAIPNQVGNKIFDYDGERYVTGELNRWLLDGSGLIYPDDPAKLEGEFGYVSDQLCGDDGTFEAEAVWVEMKVEGLSILQACSVHFPNNDRDGLLTDFRVDIFCGTDLVWSKTVTGNKEPSVYFEGFTVYNVTAIRVTALRCSIPGRYARVVEIVPGIYETWKGKQLRTVDVIQQAAFDCMSTPYGSANLELWNKNRRFDPTNKSGLFLSIEARQAIRLWFRLKLLDGSWERIPVGVYYQRDGGWSTNSDDMLTIRWALVDIVGLVADRTYHPPDTMPAVIEEWMSSIVTQLGPNFTECWQVDDDLSRIPVTCAREKVDGMKIGRLLQFLGMAVGGYPKADPATGKLRMAALSNEARGRIAMENMSSYPVLAANDDVANLTFRIGEEFMVVTGTNSASSNSNTITNPFLTSQTDVNRAARAILTKYGGQKITVRGRGDMAREVGDVMAVETAFGDTMAGRMYRQQLKISEGIMQNVPALFLLATGIQLYQKCIIVTASGTVQIPDGVTRIFAVLVAGGDGGQPGKDGSWSADGEAGSGGLGGKVFSASLSCNAGQKISAVIGSGGAPGAAGTATTFGGLTSENGARCNGWADILGGGVYGLDGSSAGRNGRDGAAGAQGAPNTGNGGGGGGGGARGVRGTGSDGDTVIKRRPGDGGRGASGGSGVLLIYYDIPEVA